MARRAAAEPGAVGVVGIGATRSSVWDDQRAAIERRLSEQNGTRSSSLVGIFVGKFFEGARKCLKTLERVKGIEPSSSAWKAVALPLSYTRAREALHASPPSPRLRRVAFAISRLASRSAAGAKAGGGGRTRTYEGVSQRIYRRLVWTSKPPFYRHS